MKAVTHTCPTAGHENRATAKGLNHLRCGIVLAQTNGAVEVTGWLLGQESTVWYERGEAGRAGRASRCGRGCAAWGATALPRDGCTAAG